MLGRRLGGVGAVALSMIVVAGGCSKSAESSSGKTVVVAVPNAVIAHVVERVMCTDGADVQFVSDDPQQTAEPSVEITLESDRSPAEGADATGPITIAVVDVAATLDVGNGNDSWVWLDPMRLIDVSQAVGGALAAADVADPDVVDRCLARFKIEMDQLVEDIYVLADSLPDAQRVVDISEPGTVYFADRFGFVLDESQSAAEAGRILSSDDLSGFETYESMMLAHVEEAIGVLRQP